jgi:signal peptidase II
MAGSRKVLLTRAAWFGLACVLGGGCDLQTKAWAEHALGNARGSLMVVDPWLELALAYNRGTAFSFIPDLGAARWLLGLFALAMVIVLLVMALRSPGHRLELLAFGTIAGGALGNGIDRLVRLSPQGGTGVVDFIKINYPWGGSWPTFNVADVLVAVGVAVLLLRSFRRTPAEATKPDPAQSGNASNCGALPPT